MAIARKCDRCGQLFELPKVGELAGFAWLNGYDEDGETQFGKQYDLCADCTDKLSDWLEGAELEQKKMRQYTIEEQVKMRLSGMEPSEIAKLTGAKARSISTNISLFKKENPDRYAELAKEAEGDSCAP